MSLRVLVIPEDPTYNGYILGPLVEAILALAGKPQARVRVLDKQGRSGFESMLKLVPEILDGWPMIDLFLFLPDRDGKVGATGENRLERLQNLENDAIANSKKLLTCAAVEEVEVWLMAAHPDKLHQLGLSTTQVRDEAKPSRGSFLNFLDQFGDSSVGQGRKRLMQEGVTNLGGLLARCDELKDLFDRISGLTIPD